MKKITLSLACLFLMSTAANSTLQQIPAPLQKALSHLNLSRSSTLNDGGSLYVSLNFDSIETLQAKSVVDSVCIAYWGDNPPKRTWKAGKIRDIYISNADFTQGYVYQDGDKSCDLLTKQTGDGYSAFIEDRLSAATFKTKIE